MRLVTRSDFDGLICAVILKEVGVIDSYTFVHPKDIQDGKVYITENDVLANVPYWPGCGLWFDHHVSEADVHLFDPDIKGVSKPAKSCARIVYDYYGGQRTFGTKWDEMMNAVDRADAAELTVDEVLDPKGWFLLSFVMDPRTGLGRYKDYRIGNYKLMEDLIDYCRTQTIDEILTLPDVVERTTRYLEHQKQYREIININSTIRGNCLIVDLRDVRELPVGNRFIEFSLFPNQNISVRVNWAHGDKVALAVGHSIINRTSRTNVGMLLREYGGGGHAAVGTCQIPKDEVEGVLEEIVQRIVNDG